MIDILCIAAHPDDVELACSGTVIKHIEAGKKVVVADLTQGELGTRGNAELRLIEARKSAQFMGLLDRVNLGFKDGLFEIDEFHLTQVVRVIRKYKPQIILTNAESDRHPDHGRAAALVERAAFLAGLWKFDTEKDNTLSNSWRTKAVYHFIQDYYLEPNFIVDISETFKKKMHSIQLFDSQFYTENENKEEPSSPISGKHFLDTVEARAKSFGRLIGAEYGEGFTCKRPIGIQNLFDLQ